MKSGKTNKQVLVLGAGFAGIRAALDVSRQSPDTRVILVSHNDYHLYHPSLYEVATAVRSDGSALELKNTVAVPVSEIIKRYRNIIFKQGWVKNVDIDRRVIQTDGGDLAYDYLVIALGSVTDYYNVPGLDKHAFALKTFEDAVRLRNHIAQMLAQFSLTRDNSYLNFVIGGGGFTGVELAGELINYLKHLLRRERDITPMVWVVEGSNQVLSGLNAKVSRTASRHLENIGVKFKLNSRITEARADGAVVNGEEFMPSRTVIWTGGVRAFATPFIKNIPCDKKSRVMVSSRLNLDVYPEVFIVGDVSCYIDPAMNAPLPQTAQVAIHQARYAAKAVVRLINHQEIPPYRPKTNFPFLIPLSGKHAIYADKYRVWYGFGPYILRRGADLRYLVSVLPFWRALAYWLKGSLIYIKND